METYMVPIVRLNRKDFFKLLNNIRDLDNFDGFIETDIKAFNVTSREYCGYTNNNIHIMWKEESNDFFWIYEIKKGNERLNVVDLLSIDKGDNK